MARFSLSRVTILAGVSLLMLAGTGYGKGKKGGGGGRAAAPPPAPVNPAIAADQQELATDQLALAKANKDLNEASAKLTTDFEKTAEVEAAKKAVADATAEVQAAREKALAGLGDNAAYKAAVAKEAAAKAELNKLRAADDPDKDAIAAKSSEVFQDGGVTSKLERSALEADPGYLAADRKLTEANAALMGLRSKFKESLKTEPSLATLRQARDDAQTKVTTAQAKFDADRRGTATASGG